MKKILLATVALSTLIAAPAMAADLAVKAPVYKAPPPVYYYSWTGCYVGGFGGGLWVNKDFRLTSVAIAPFGAFVGNGIALGGHDASSGIGIQGDWGWSNANGSHVDPFLGVTTLTSNTKNLGSVTGRIGYAWDRFL